MKNITLLSFAFVAFSLTLFAQPKADPEIDLLWGVKIPMRDGVKLNGTVTNLNRYPKPLP
jgi:hypothetical protein